MAKQGRPAWSGRLVLAAGSMLDQPVDAILEAAAAAGFDGVGLRLSAEHRVADPGALRTRAASLGMTVFDAEVHRIGTDTPGPAPLVEAAAAAGAEALLVVSDLPDRAATVDRLADLSARCRRAGLRLGLEYMAWTTPAEPLDAIAIAEAVGCELLVDVLHHVRVGAGVAELDAVVESGRLGWVQLCDAPLAPPDGPFPAAWIHEARHARCPPGAGELPLAALVARLPPDVDVSVEVQSDELAAVPPLERARLLHDSSRSILAVPGSVAE